MKRLRLAQAALAFQLLVFFSFDRLVQSQSTTFSISNLSFLVGIAVIAAILVVPRAISVPSGLWVAVAILTHALFRVLWGVEGPFTEASNISALFVESFLIAMVVWLAHVVSSDIREVERVVEMVQPEECDGVVVSDDDHPKAIQREFTRSRRYSHPLSLVIVALDIPPAREWSMRRNEELQRILAYRYLFEQVARIVRREIRRTDYVFRHWDRPNELIVLCPEIDHEHVGMLTGKLERVLNSNGISARFGNASFPAHALTFDGLLTIASQALKKPAAGQRVPARPSREPVMGEQSLVHQHHSHAQNGARATTMPIHSWSDNGIQEHPALHNIRISPMSPLPVDQSIHSAEATSVE